MAESGIFGKLPGHGDFIQRGVPASFSQPWDDWLQRAIYGSREIVGEGWLDYYLTSPIWRFALSPGVLDGHAWAGVLVPSVDSVGRYFPLTMVAASACERNPFVIQAAAENWYEHISETAIQGLQQALLVEELLERFPSFPELTVQNPAKPLGGGEIFFSGQSGVTESFAPLLGHICTLQYQSFSLWWCGGSQHLAPTTLLSAGLPDPSLYCSMLGASSGESIDFGTGQIMRW